MLNTYSSMQTRGPSSAPSVSGRVVPSSQGVVCPRVSHRRGTLVTAFSQTPPPPKSPTLVHAPLRVKEKEMEAPLWEVSTESAGA